VNDSSRRRIYSRSLPGGWIFRIDLTGQPPPARRKNTRIIAAILTGAILVAAFLISPILQPSKTLITTSTVTTTVSKLEPCAGQLVWNVNNSAIDSVPVLLMQPGSTTYICVTYQSSWQGDATKFQQSAVSANDAYEFGLGIGKEHCTAGAQGSFDCTSAISHSFVIQVYPSSIQYTAATDYVSVLYTVTALGNSTGFYDSSAPFQYCYGMPLAVGYTSSQVNGSDFAPRLVHSCPFLFFTPKEVSVAGMSFLHVALSQFPSPPVG
jgi:hypothetical protein